MIHIADRFDLGERIGGGAAADVHRAFDHKIDREVVVRILRANAAVDEEYVERFQRESEAASGIGHPNVVEVLDHGVIDGRPFVVREFVRGGTLEELLDRRGVLPEEEARALAEQIARGLEASHARGVLHRDLNSGNVFVTPEGNARIVDFGMASTQRHPAPEQVSGKQIDERADVYGMGVVLYQMLTGQPPRERLVPPRRLAPRLSKRIEEVALRALQTEPGRRYASAAAMADALRAPTAPVMRPTLVPPPQPTQQIARPTERVALPEATTSPRRRRASALPFVLIGVALLLALLIGALTLAGLGPSNTAVLSGATTPRATTAPTVFPAPTSLPPVETTLEPTPEPPPDPTVAPTPLPATPPPPPAAPAVSPVSQEPAGTVRSFYILVSQHRYAEAAALWSDRLKAQYSPSTNINGRFDRTNQIVVRRIEVVAQSAGVATVDTDILEVLDSGVTRHWVGQWQLVSDGSRWLMDAPNLRPA